MKCFPFFILQVEMNDRLDRLFELSDSHTSRAAHAQSEAGRDFAELSGNHDALRYRLIYFRDWAKRLAPGCENCSGKLRQK